MSCTSLQVQTQAAAPTYHDTPLSRPSLPSSIHGSKRYTVHPTSLIKSAVLSRRKHLVISGVDRDQQMRHAADELRTTRLRKYHQSTRSRAEAEENVDVKSLAETQILTQVEQQGKTFSALDPATALALANATQETLRAELVAVTFKIRECLSNLQVLQDSADESRARLEDAEVQVQVISEELESQGHDITAINNPIIYVPPPPPLDLTSLPRSVVLMRSALANRGKEEFSDLSSYEGEQWEDAEDWETQS